MKNIREIRFFILMACLIFSNSLFSQELQKDGKLFLGANFGVGLGYHKAKGYSYSGGEGYMFAIPWESRTEKLPINAGLDVAYETIDDIFVGAYSAIGTDFVKKDVQYLDLGALLMIGLNDSYSLILGLGFHVIDYKYNGDNLRIGFLSPRNVYMMLEGNYNNYGSKSDASVLISFGYRIF